MIAFMISGTSLSRCTKGNVPSPISSPIREVFGREFTAYK